jgi:hypothetical protein
VVFGCFFNGVSPYFLFICVTFCIDEFAVVIFLSIRSGRPKYESRFSVGPAGLVCTRWVRWWQGVKRSTGSQVCIVYCGYTVTGVPRFLRPPQVGPLAAGQSGFGLEEVQEDTQRRVWVPHPTLGYAEGVVLENKGDQLEIRFKAQHGNWEQVRQTSQSTI